MWHLGPIYYSGFPRFSHISVTIATSNTCFCYALSIMRMWNHVNRALLMAFSTVFGSLFRLETYCIAFTTWILRSQGKYLVDLEWNIRVRGEYNQWLSTKVDSNNYTTVFSAWLNRNCPNKGQGGRTSNCGYRFYATHQKGESSLRNVNFIVYCWK